MAEQRKPAGARGVRHRLARLERNVLEDMGLPVEALAGVTRLTILGRDRLRVENHRGIRSYSAEVITIAIAGSELRVEGNSLLIRSILPEELLIEGELASLSWRETSGD